jgi:hypothetical protein
LKHFPDAITKRDLLHGYKKMTPEQKKTLGEKMAKEGWYSDAIDFLTACPEELKKIKTQLIAQGDVFLLLKISKIIGEESKEELLIASENAEEQGKIRYAIRGYEKLGKTEKVSTLKEKIAEDGDIQSELNSVFIPKTEEEREEEES